MTFNSNNHHPRFGIPILNFAQNPFAAFALIQQQQQQHHQSGTTGLASQQSTHQQNIFTNTPYFGASYATLAQHHHLSGSAYGRRSVSPTYSERITQFDRFYGAAQHQLGSQQNASQFQQTRFLNEPQPQTPNSLKIPTTPTRSKSLSPSLRSVVQPPRIRHKQQALDSTFTFPSSTLQQRLQEQLAQKQTFNGSTNTSFPFLSGLKDNNKEIQEQISSYTKPQQQQQQQVQLTQIQKPIAVLGTNKNTISNLAAIQQQQQQQTLQQLLQQSQKSQIDSTLSVTKQLTEQKPQSQVQQKMHGNSKLEEETKKQAIEVAEKAQKTMDTGEVQQQQQEHQQVEQEEENKKQQINIVKFKLPSNMRMKNLNNFPINNNPNVKRSYSLVMQRMKNALQTSNTEKCLNIIKNNLQNHINEQIKLILEEYKQDFIEPAVDNMRKNNDKVTVTNDDILSLCMDLLDEAKMKISDELETKLIIKRKNASSLLDGDDTNASSCTNKKFKQIEANVE